MAYYKATFNDEGKLKTIQSSDTPSSEFYLPLWVVNQLKPRHSTQHEVDTLYAQWQELERVKLANESNDQVENDDIIVN